MTKYSDIPFLRHEIEGLNIEINTFTRAMADIDPSLKPRCEEVINLLKQSRTEYMQRHAELIKELKVIEAHDPEIYRMIVFHDLKGLTWHQVFNRTCEGLRSDYPACYCKKMVARYLEKYGYVKNEP